MILILLAYKFELSGQRFWEDCPSSCTCEPRSRGFNDPENLSEEHYRTRLSRGDLLLGTHS